MEGISKHFDDVNNLEHTSYVSVYDIFKCPLDVSIYNACNSPEFNLSHAYNAIATIHTQQNCDAYTKF